MPFSTAEVQQMLGHANIATNHIYDQRDSDLCYLLVTAGK